MSELPPLLDAEEAPASERTRALRETPLRERAGMRRALESGGSGLSALERALQRLETRLDSPAPAEQAQAASEPPEPPARIAEGLPARTRLETEWLAVPSGAGPQLLHHADLTLMQLGELAAHELVDTPGAAALLLTCGRITPTVALPGPLDRHEMGRCPGCCANTGIPQGFGSPKNDPAARDALAARLGGLT